MGKWWLDGQILERCIWRFLARIQSCGGRIVQGIKSGDHEVKSLFLELVKVVCEMNVQLSSTIIVFDFFKIFTVCGELK
jgi:hypothetical protein